MFHIVRNQVERPLTFLIHAAALNHIYRFIADYSFENGAFRLPDGGRAAFFPGTFDPFSLSHRGIVEEIRRHGFEVYLAIDEFSWSKKTQPRLVRRKIAAMSVADDAGAFLFPDDVPVNIANPGDLKRLRALFPTKEVFIVVGSDVITHASAYRKSPVADSIHTFPHIIFRRNSEASEQEKEGSETAASTTIRGEILQLSLPVQLEDISSTRIRENIDCNRDISNLMDPIAQNYIYSRNLYLREPQYKPVIDAETLRFEAIPAGAVTEEQIEQLGETLFKDRRGRSRFSNPASSGDGAGPHLGRSEAADSGSMCRLPSSAAEQPDGRVWKLLLCNEDPEADHRQGDAPERTLCFIRTYRSRNGTATSDRDVGLCPGGGIHLLHLSRSVGPGKAAGSAAA